MTTGWAIGSADRWRRPRRHAVVVLVAAVAWALALPGPADAGARKPARSDPPPSGRAPMARVKALPPGARAQFPAYDGDGFFVALPPRPAAALTAESVRDEVVAPILPALGYSVNPSSLLMPPSAGARMPVASVRGLARAALADYEKTRGLYRTRTQGLFDAALGASAADEALDAMLFGHEGRTFGQIVAHLERQEIQYAFSQAVDGVPIEYTAVIASRWEGQTVTTVFGTLRNCYETPACFAITNTPRLTPREAAAEAIRLLAPPPRTRHLAVRRILGEGDLVLLPDGVDATGRELLTYVYRTIASFRLDDRDASVMLWANAERPGIVAAEWLESPFDDGRNSVAGAGMAFRRDPGGGATPVRFRVDPAEDGRYVLKLQGVMDRVHLEPPPDGDDAGDVGIDAGAMGSSSGFANFAQAPLDDVGRAPCGAGPRSGNAAFLQINLFATIYRGVAAFVAGGMFEPFPELPLRPRIDTSGQVCQASSGLTFYSCPGYRDPRCPDAQVDAEHPMRNVVSYAVDNTIIGHEIGHLVTAALARSRPRHWCRGGAAGPACPVPNALWMGEFHDFADFWAAHLESTNCIGGWMAKNLFGPDASLYCKRHNEAGGFPRLLDPAIDHFPEHRELAQGGQGYADGQVTSAALWAARLGLRSRSSVLGPGELAAGLQRALRNAGFIAEWAGNSDHGLYQLQEDLLRHLVDTWGSSAGGSAAMVNKVVSGFASAGLFLVPHDCLSSGSRPSPNCGDEPRGADAVIDVDDREPIDDPVLLGVVHPERDFVKPTGPAPRFLVWTGPRYRFDETGGKSTFQSPAPCNARFRVELSLDPTFTTTVATSGWVRVSRTADRVSACRASWTPGPRQWQDIAARGPGTKVYYRVRTRSDAAGSQRVSTRPGNGLWVVPPPFFVITATGRPDF